MSNDEQSIREVINTWMRATAEGNVPQILELMDEDAVFLVQGQSPVRGRATFAAGLEKALQKFHIESTSDVQEIEVAGNLAYCWNQLQVIMTPRAEGSPVRRSGYTLTIFRKSNEGKWVLFRDANFVC